jgi:hypothetical protein
MHLSLVPAYGRDYSSKSAVLADFEANKDFVNVGFDSHGICNRSDLIFAGVRSVNIRYSKNRKVVVVDLPKGGK